MSDWVQKYHANKRQGQVEQDQKGGPGSGHRGHAGRPGQVGGSAPAEGGNSSPSEISVIEDMLRKNGRVFDIYEIPRLFKSQGRVQGAFWILRDGTILKSKQSHPDDARKALNAAGVKSAALMLAITKRGIIRWHGMRGEWAFDTPRRVTISQRHTILDILLTVADRRWFTVTAKIYGQGGTMDADQLARNLQI